MAAGFTFAVALMHPLPPWRRWASRNVSLSALSLSEIFDLIAGGGVFSLGKTREQPPALVGPGR